MTQPRWRRVKSVFHRAQALPRDRRASFIVRECAGDTDMRDEVQRLADVTSEVLEQCDSYSRSLAESSTALLGEMADRLPAPLASLHGAHNDGAGDARAPRPQTGDVIADRYRLEEELGAGGFGTVYAAVDRIGDRRVALKLVALTSEFQAERYRRELATLRRGRLPGVVELLDDGNVGAWAFLVMRLVEGTWFPGDDIDDGDVSGILTRGHEFLEALARLHAAGVFHRDLKPSNVLVAADGHVTIVDLGIAEDTTDPDRWKSGRPVMGTPPFMAPERLAGAPACPRTDLHAAGMMLLEAFTGTEPHIRTNARRRSESVRDLLGRLPVGLPDDVVRVLAAMVSQDPADRPADVPAVLESLRLHVPPRVEPELPRLGSRDVIARILDAASERRPIDVHGKPGSGRSRALADAERELRDGGCVVLRLSANDDDTDPLARIVPDGGAPAVGGSPTERDDALRARLRRWLADGAVLLADDADALDPATRGELESLRKHGCVVRVTSEPHGEGAVEVPFLSRDALRDLVRSPNRLYHLRDQVADLLWDRTRGCPAHVEREIRSWCTAGLATWADGLIIEPQAVTRVRAAGVVAVPVAHTRATNALHSTVQDVWDVLSIAGTGLTAEAVAVVLDRAPRRAASALPELEAIGAIDVDEDGRAWAIARSPHVAILAPERRAAWSHRIADQLAPGSETAFRHLVLAERHDDACRTAMTVAEAHVAAGRNEAALIVLDAALPIARRHLPGSIALYDDLVSLLARVAISLARESAVELARYHVELAPEPTPSTRGWGEILAAAAKCLRRDVQGALNVLDGISRLPSDEHRRMHHIVAHFAAQRSGDIAALRERTVDAARWARKRADREARSLASSFTGWIRYHEGSYAAAASLHARAARLTRSPRARVTALLDAASAAIESGDLDAAMRCATQAAPIARELRDVVNLARAERIQRVAAYRSNEVMTIDEELVAATERLSAAALRGLTALTEAAIAWRSGRLTRAADLADRAHEAFASAPTSAPALLMRALAAAARCRDDDALRRGLAEAPDRLQPIGVAAQAAALYADVGGAAALPKRLVERSVSWARSVSRPEMRREVLSPNEVMERLAQASAGAER